MSICDRYASQLPSSGCVESVVGSTLPRNSNSPASGGSAAAAAVAACPYPPVASPRHDTIPMRRTTRISTAVLVRAGPSVLIAVRLALARRGGPGPLIARVGLAIAHS